MIATAAPPVPFRLFSLRFVAILLCLMGVSHIVATLISMRDSSRSAYTRLTPLIPMNTMKVMPPITPASQLLPFLGPDTRYGICRFDARSAPVNVSADLLDIGWTVAVFTTEGTVAYAASAPPGRLTRISLTLVSGDDRFLGLTPEARGKVNAAEAPLTVTAREGLVVVRAPDKGLAYAAEAEAGLARSHCEPRS